MPRWASTRPSCAAAAAYAGSCPGLEPQKTQSLSMWTRYSNEQALMLAGTETLATIANHWLARFEHALANGDRALLESLFHSESHWRDVLALTWRIGTVSGTRAIAAALTQHAPRARPGGFRTDPERTAPRHVTRAGKRCVEAIYRFETALGCGSGVLRFFPTEEEPRAWTLLTALDELRDHEENVGRRRAGRPHDCSAPRAAPGRHADRRPLAARRRQLAQALPRTHAAQPGARQPPAVHAVPAELAGLHPEGQARELVRVLRRGDGAQLLGRHRIH